MSRPNAIDGAYQIFYSIPGPIYIGTKTSIEALTGVQLGAFAVGYTSTPADGVTGFYDGSAWVWGSGGGSGGVESVTGDGVNNTDPLNPVISYPTPGDIGAEPALGYTPENVANKSTDVDADKTSNIKYPSVKAVYDWAVGLFVQKNAGITGATKTKITYDAKGLVTAGADATTSDIPEGSNLYFTAARVLATVLTGFAASAGTVSASDTILQAFNKVVGNIALKLTANAPITGATKTKITYDANGLVTAGADLSASDIPNLDASKITSGTLDSARLPDEFITNANNIFDLLGVGSSGWTGTINGAPSGTTVTYTNVSGNKNTLVPTSTSQLGKQRLYNTTRGNYALISTSNGTSTITLTATVPANWANGDTITTISPTVASGQNHVDIEITSGDLVGKTNVWLWGVIKDSGASVILRFHPFETFASSKQFNIFSPAANVAVGSLQAYKLVSNILTIAWSASGAATASVTVRQVGYVK